MSHWFVFADARRNEDFPKPQARFDRWLVWHFDSAEDAVEFRLRHNADKLIEDNGAIAEMFIRAVWWEQENDHFRDSRVRLTHEKRQAVLMMLNGDSWTTEEEIARKVSLTPFEWRSLFKHDSGRQLLTPQKRKTGFVWKLSKEGVRNVETIRRVKRGF